MSESYLCCVVPLVRILCKNVEGGKTRVTRVFVRFVRECKDDANTVPDTREESGSGSWESSLIGVHVHGYLETFHKLMMWDEENYNKSNNINALLVSYLKCTRKTLVHTDSAYYVHSWFALACVLKFKGPISFIEQWQIYYFETWETLTFVSAASKSETSRGFWVTYGQDFLMMME